MKVCFLVNDLRLSGGVGVVVRHASELRERHGFDVTIALTQTSEVWEHYPGLEHVHIRTLPEALAEEFDIAIATWWDTTYHLFSLTAKRYVYFIQSLEDRFYQPDDIERAIAGMTFDLPVTFITEAKWIAETIEQLRPEADCFYVRNGMDKTIFSGPEEPPLKTAGELRILIEGHPEVWFKAIDEALAATAQMSEPRHVTLVSPATTAEERAHVDRLISSVSHQGMAELYRESDVVLKLSRVEGMFGPPLEGFHMGATCVVTPVTGHDEYVEHNWNGLVTDWDDTTGTARYLDLLAKNPKFLHFLRWNAIRTAQGWPTWQQSGQMMALALWRIANTEPAAEPQLATQITADIWGASTQPFRRMQRIQNERNEMARYQRRYYDVVNSRAYKIGVALRNVWKRPGIQQLTSGLRDLYKRSKLLRKLLSRFGI